MKIAEILNAAIKKMVTDDKTREAIIAEMGKAAGIDAATVGQILGGSIKCPPMERLSGLATALKIQLKGLTDAAKADGCTFAAKESQDIHMDGAVRLLEAKDDKGKEWDVVLIEAGKSLNNYTYPIEALEKAIPLFEGTRAFANRNGDHVDDESKKCVYDIVGWFSNVRRDNNRIVASFNIVESATWLAEMMRSAWDKGKKDIVGFSIDALGKAALKKQPGGLTYIVESIKHVLSVDVVVNPAAGGKILKLIASNGDGQTGQPNSNPGKELVMIEKLLAMLEAQRPDLYKGIDKENIQVDELVKMLESEMKDDTGVAFKEAQKKMDDTLEKIETLGKQATCATILKESIASSELPDLSKGRINKRFAGQVFKESELDDAIKDEKEFLSKLSESGKVTGFGGSPTISADQKDKNRDALDGFFAGENVGKTNRFRTLKEAYSAITGNRNQDSSIIFRESFPAHLSENPGTRRLAEALNSSSWAEVLGDSITRRMLAEYKVPGLDLWRKIVSDVVPVSDFRTQRRTRTGGYGLLPAVAEGGSYEPLTSPGDEEATYTVAKKGGTEKLTLEMIANDDVGATRRIPRQLARAASRTLYRFVFDFIEDNPTIYDAVALFHASHGTLGSVALSATELFARRLAMRDQAAFGTPTEILGLLPAFLLVSGENEKLGFELLNSQKVNASNNNEPNLFFKTMELIVVDYWTDANDWALVANPMDVPTIEMGFFEGKEEPELFVQDMPNVGSKFDSDEITYKIRHIYSGAVMDYRGFQKNVVA